MQVTRAHREIHKKRRRIEYLILLSHWTISQARPSLDSRVATQRDTHSTRPKVHWAKQSCDKGHSREANRIKRQSVERREREKRRTRRGRKRVDKYPSWLAGCFSSSLPLLLPLLLILLLRLQLDGWVACLSVQFYTRRKWEMLHTGHFSVTQPACGPLSTHSLTLSHLFSTGHCIHLLASLSLLSLHAKCHCTRHTIVSKYTYFHSQSLLLFCSGHTVSTLLATPELVSLFSGFFFSLPTSISFSCPELNCNHSQVDSRGLIFTFSIPPLTTRASLVPFFDPSNPLLILSLSSNAHSHLHFFFHPPSLPPSSFVHTHCPVESFSLLFYSSLSLSFFLSLSLSLSPFLCLSSPLCASCSCIWPSVCFFRSHWVSS